MSIKTFALKGLRKTYRRVFDPKFPIPDCILSRNKANDEIYKILISDNPCMISRFGSIEIGIVTNHISIHDNRNIISKSLQYITDDYGLPWWDKLWFKSMKNNAGIFPETTDILEKFAERYLEDAPLMDLIGSFNYTEKYMPIKEDIVRVHLECMYPFWSERPWTLALQDKKVLVVHPFVETIKQQYSRRKLLFDDKRILPEFELICVKAVQSNAGNEVDFKDWFEALKVMEDDISNKEFDYCILGCGAYGLPLAAFVKRLGKKAIHMGGGSQLLFGIKGKRWDNDVCHCKNLPHLNTNYSSLYNEYWVRPSKGETPSAASNVEGACYW